MTDNAPDTLDIISDGSLPSGETSAAAVDSVVQEKAFLPLDTIDEDGLALRIEEPDDPGIILVAVAEPSSLHGAHVPLRESEGSQAEHTYGDTPVISDTSPAIPVYGDLVEIAAVRLPGLGPALFFLTKGITLVPGDTVLVEVEDGQVLGETAAVMRMNPEHLDVGDGTAIRSILRKASDKDIQVFEANDASAREALEFCQQCIRDRNLDMKLVDVLTLLDCSKMVFYFTAPSRIDFRELVKDLVRCYRTRIELRQIGVRHETQMVGALGNCGMVCCCRRYLRKFAPVAIKMAKEQNVFLNPVKISGICGRLLCCLAYEQDHYDEFYRSCPKLGKKYHTDAGVLRVLRASLFRESVTALTESNEEVEYPLAEWNALNPFRPNAPQQNQAAKKTETRDNANRSSGEDKNRPPREGQPARSDKKYDKNERPRRQDGSATRDASVAVTMKEESLAFVEEKDGLALSVSHSRAEISFSLENQDVDGFSIDTESDDGDDANSIFGLAPKRENAPGVNGASGGGQPQDAQAQRKKRPRRHARKKMPSGASS